MAKMGLAHHAIRDGLKETLRDALPTMIIGNSRNFFGIELSRKTNIGGNLAITGAVVLSVALNETGAEIFPDDRPELSANYTYEDPAFVEKVVEAASFYVTRVSRGW